MKAVDLTHTLSFTIPTWDMTCDFTLTQVLDYKDCTAPDVFRKHDIQMSAGTGTHMDAPSHAASGGRTIEQLTMEEIVTDCIVIHIDNADENYTLTRDVIEDFEKKNGMIGPNSFVIISTGWSNRWNTPKEYHNDHNFPSVDVSAAELLLKRNISGLGIDTLSADTGKNGFPVHRAILGANKYLIENIANTAGLPPTGAKIVIAPMKIEGGSEAPIRLIALI